jgi:putative flippase GtrA
MIGFGRRLLRSARLVSLVRFLLVGLTGIAVNELVYVGLVQELAVWFVIAAILSTEASTTWNFLGNELWAFSDRKYAGPAWVRFLAYAAMNNSLLVVRVPLLWLLTDLGQLGPAWSNLVTLVLLFGLRFIVSDGWVWRRQGANPYSEDSSIGRRGLAAFRYDICGLIRLDSDVELPELAYFRTDAATPPEIRIKVRLLGTVPSARVAVRRDGDTVTYREQLGVLGADFNLALGNPIEIKVSPLLALSRHVLYTNIIEALLRFLLVSKGYVLLHSAGLEVDGKASLLSAQTDTGKTSTVINLVRDRGWGFISDDMSIIDPAGRVRTFPKPMTLSYHTMARAVDARTLNAKQRMQLQVQSRVHSKSGRTVGRRLGSLNVPIMSINSLLQIVVPPPKYHITALLPAHITPEAPIQNVFLMERGEPLQERMTLDAAVDQLIENTDDAYGFPPFASLAPKLVINGANYFQLRLRERELLTVALTDVAIWRLRVPGHEWADLLPGLIQVEGHEPVAVAIPIGGDGREPMGVPIEAEEREPVAIPVGGNGREPVAIPVGGNGREPVAIPVETDRVETGVPIRSGVPPMATAALAAIPLPTSTGLGSARSDVARTGTRRTTSRSRDIEGVQISAGHGEPPGAPVSMAEPDASLAGAPALDIPGRRLPRLRDWSPSAVDLANLRERIASRARAGVRTWSAMAAILFAATVVRLWSIGTVGFNNDEAVYAGQAASLAGDQTYGPLFAVFRAHPLLVQFLNSVPFRFLGVNDITPRLISVAFGVGAVALVYATGSLLYNHRVGVIAAAILALMPYDVIVTRQGLLDGPETTLYVLSIYELARFAKGGQVRWLYVAAFTTGLTVLAKETAVLIVPVAVIFLLLAPEIRIALRHQLVSLGLFAIAAAPYPLAIVIGKAADSAQSFLLWQILRQPNHTWTFYGQVVPGAMGLLVVAAGIGGLAYVVRRGIWQDRLLTAWILVPLAFFELWPVKGYQYLMPIAPAVAVLAALAFDRLVARAAAIQSTYGSEVAAATMSTPQPQVSPAPTLLEDPRPTFELEPDLEPPSPRPLPQAVGEAIASGLAELARRMRPLRRFSVAASSGLLGLTLLSIALPSAAAVSSPAISGSLAGTGGLPGGREAGLWIRANVPRGAVFLTEGPTLANIVEFYGQRRAYALSVSPNPIRRNPAYDPIVNPDRALQLNQIHYIATDIWSAQRSPFFAQRLRGYISRYHGVLVHEQRAMTSDAAGAMVERPVIQIYEVRP